ncbi:hypothetical protein ACFX2G_013419 [Malus domestica]
MLRQSRTRDVVGARAEIWHQSMKASIETTLEAVPWHKRLLTQATTGQPCIKTPRSMYKGETTTNALSSYLHYLLANSTCRRALGHSCSGRLTW